ncbi:MAG: trehalase family glycosidase [Candidatus Saccharimonadales bacterium]
MIRRTKNTIKAHVKRNPHVLQLATKIKKPAQALTAEDVAEARHYIQQFWVNLERYHPHDEESLIGLPNAYLVPAHDPTSTFNFDEMYYWDSYFMVQGMLKNPDKKELVLGILENLFTLFGRFKVIPNASRTYLMGRSQPPLLTSFIFDVYEAYGLDKRWLAQAIGYAKQEYETVWMGQAKPFDHQVYQGLSRYYDINVLHDLAEAESGWDMTNRFNRHCLDYLPVDLNALLYKYERDFARAAHILENLDEQVSWEKIAKQRHQNMQNLMWSSTKGLYYDFNYKKERKGQVASLASYVPLWAELVDQKTANQLAKNLRRFDADGGLVTTDGQMLKSALPQKMPLQWAYPNGWAPVHFFVVQGLEKYGYHEEAKRIALKWLKTCNDWFTKHGVFLEKYNMIQPTKHPVEGVYPSQTGFGWTNAIFERLCQDYLD